MPHRDPDDPPRRRANQAKGHGTWETDRPPVPGVVGPRQRAGGGSGWGGGAPQPSWSHATVLPATEPGAMVYTDDWNGYNPLGRSGRARDSQPQPWRVARDDDGDGVARYIATR